MINWLKKKAPAPAAFATLSLPCQATDVQLGVCINEIYLWAVGIVGLVAFARIVYAGIMYLQAAGKPGDVKEAKTIIYNSILGIVLLFSSYIILQTINPELVGGDLKIEAIKSGGAGSKTGELMLSNVAPLRARPDDMLVLTGTGFDADTKVYIDHNEYDSSVIFVSASEIKVQLGNTIFSDPDNTVEVWVQKGDKKSNSFDIFIIAPENGEDEFSE